MAVLPSVCCSFDSSALLSSWEKLTLPLFTCRHGFPPCRTMLHSLREGSSDVRLILLLIAASVAACIFSSSFLPSMLTARAIRLVNIVIAISMTGSPQWMLAPLSSELRIFFIQSSGDRFELMPLSSFFPLEIPSTLYCAMMSLPLCSA